MKIIKKKYIVPLFDNKHIAPYGVVHIIVGETVYFRRYELGIKDIFIICHKKYRLVNQGTLYCPKLSLVIYSK